jgi:hypothetical protein
VAVLACVLAVAGVTAAWAAMRLDLRAAAPTSKASASAAKVSHVGVSQTPVSVTAMHVSTVIFQGVPGELSVVGASTTQVSLTGRLRWSVSAPVASDRFEDGGQTLLLSYQCAAGSTCTEDFQLTVPYGEIVALNQSSAQLTLTGLTGEVSVKSSNVQVIATGLRTTVLAASITSGTLTASFQVAPALVAVTLASAQCTLQLPVSTDYQVSQQVSDGSVTVDVPRTTTAAHRITAQVTAGTLELTP